MSDYLARRLGRDPEVVRRAIRIRQCRDARLAMGAAQMSAEELARLRKSPLAQMFINSPPRLNAFMFGTGDGSWPVMEAVKVNSTGCFQCTKEFTGEDRRTGDVLRTDGKYFHTGCYNEWCEQNPVRFVDDAKMWNALRDSAYSLAPSTYICPDCQQEIPAHKVYACDQRKYGVCKSCAVTASYEQSVERVTDTWKCENHPPGLEVNDIPVGEKCPVCQWAQPKEEANGH